MSTKIKKIVHQHLYLNKERILFEYNSSKHSDDIYKVKFHLFTAFNPSVKNIYITSDNERIMMSRLDLGEEWRIPKIMLIALSEVNIKEVIESEYERKNFDDVDNLLVILNNIAVNYIIRNNIYMTETLWKLLNLISEGDLSSKWLRDEIYNELGIISSYIIYSNPNEYNNY